MRYTKLGNTGLSVTELCLGCMSFGLDGSDKYSWSLGENESRAIIERAIELGITFFDTANTYSWGDSERVLGSVLAEYDRDEMVIASKVFNAPAADPHPNSTGLSRKTITQELELSLNRLGIDTLDLYQIHRWDYETPIAETNRALTDCVRQGRVRYLGASSMFLHQFAEAVHLAEIESLAPYSTMQNHYNLVYREEEREMMPFCKSRGIGVLPWSPLARGLLARSVDTFEDTTRGKDESTRKKSRHEIYKQGGGIEINRRVRELAESKGVSMAQIAIAWQLHNEWVDVPIIGVTTIDQLESTVEATEISISRSDIDYLEEPYEPVPVDGPLSPPWE